MELLGNDGDRRIKVLHVITHLGVGGATDNTLMTVAGHDRDRYEVHLAAGVLSPGDNYTEWRERAEESADATFRLEDLRREMNPLRDARAVRAIATLVREQGYDIVHTHCSKAGFVGRVAARRAGCPIVVHTCHAFAWQVADPRSHARLPSRAARSILLRMDRHAASLSDALITVSDLNRHMAIDVGLAPPEKFTTIHSGIELSTPDELPHRDETCRALDLDPTRPVVGTVGRLAKQKDPVTFVQAAKIVLRTRPDAQFVLIGNGPLEEKVRDTIGGDERIRMLGHRDDVRALLTVLDAFVLSSRWEGLGRALTEAIAVGLPVAATAVDGIPELIRHGETGRLSEPGDAQALAANITWILENRTDALAIAARARVKVMEGWGVDRMVRQIEELYARLLAEHEVSVNGALRNSDLTTPKP